MESFLKIIAKYTALVSGALALLLFAAAVGLILWPEIIISIFRYAAAAACAVFALWATAYLILEKTGEK